MDIGISKENRVDVAKGLSRLLADTYTLYIKTHNYHWNVTGPMFQTLHTMFEAQYTELATAVDLIAERIRALGERAPGSLMEFSKLASVKEEEGKVGAREMIQNLVDAQEALIRTAREVSPSAAKAQDLATEDLLTQRIQLHGKTAWKLRSLLED
jgi:starvation-inducible DNA-binding protein